MIPIKMIFKQKQNFIFHLNFSVVHFIELQIMMKDLENPLPIKNI